MGGLTSHSFPLAVDILSGVLLVVLGAYVASVKPRRPGNRAFGVFSAASGTFYVVINVAPFLPPLSPERDGVHLLAILLALASVAALALVALTFPTPLDRRRPALLATAAGALYWMGLAVQFTDPVTASYDPGASRAVGILSANVFNLVVAGIWGVLILLALRYRDGDAAFRRQVALASSGLVLFPAYFARAAPADWGGFEILRQPIPTFATGVSLSLLVVLVSLWIANAVRSAHPGPAWMVAWISLASALLGTLSASFLPGWSFDGGPGLMRAAGVAILGYAIVRHQLLGIDLHVRWTIRQSTIGAIFVVAFFVAGEGAQILFGAGNEWVGLAAAGALVFALAPLQRVAERIATAAVPMRAPGVRGEAHAGYRRQVELAWRDGAVTAKERLMLDAARDAFGVPLDEAARIEREAAERVAAVPPERTPPGSRRGEG